MRLRFGAAALLACLALGLVNCGLLDPHSRLGELEDSRRLWQSSRVQDYLMEFRGGCNCSAEFNKLAVVEVERGVIKSVVLEETGLPPQQTMAAWYTIDELFEVVDDAINDGVDSLDVVYDETLGYPQFVFVDPDRSMIDDTRFYRVVRLAVVN